MSQNHLINHFTAIITRSTILMNLLVVPVANAQLDPSNATLLRSGSSNIDHDALDSSRYNIRPESSSTSRRTREEARNQSLKQTNSADLKRENQPQQPPTIESSLSPDNPTNEPRPIANPQHPSANNSSEKTNSDTLPPSEGVRQESNDMSAQVRDLLLGGSQENVQQYKRLLHPYDIRQNMVEVGASAGVFYQNSASNYWYRRYYSYGPLVSAEATLWLTPFLGFKGEFSTSLASDMNGNPEGTRRIPADHQWWSGGLRFRKSFGLDRKSSHLLIGVDFNESRLTVPADDPDRIRLRTSGMALSLGIQVPSTLTHHWELGVRLLPRGDQHEGKTGSSVRSGFKQQTYSIGFWLGSRFILDRKNQYFWQISHYLDKSLYDGQANQADPLTGIQPAGVQVSIGTTILRFGYTWGE